MRYRWTILAVGVAAQAAWSAVGFAVPILAPALRDEYELSLGELGVLLAGAGGGMVFTLVPWGVLTDRLGERAVVALGLGSAGGAFLLAASAEEFGLLFVALTLAGMVGASVSAASGRAVMGWFAANERGLALGIRQTAVPLGGALAAVGVPPLLDAVGLAQTFVALAVVSFAAAVAGVVWLRDPPHDDESAGAADERPLRDRRIWRLSLGSTFYVCVQIAILSFLVVFLHDERGFSVASAGAVLAAIHVAGGALRIVFGALSDRVGSRVRPLRLVGLGIAAATAAAAALLSAPAVVLVPLLVLAGTLAVSWNGLSFTAAAELAGRSRSGAALGLQQTALAAGCAVTPAVFAFVVDAGSWQLAFALLAVLPLVGYRVLAPLA